MPIQILFCARIGRVDESRIPDGCIALIDPDAEWVSGKIYAVRVGETDATVKIVNFYKSSVELVPNSYDPRFKRRNIRLPRMATIPCTFSAASYGSLLLSISGNRSLFRCGKRVSGRFTW